MNIQNLQNLLNIQGTLTENAPIGDQSWFRCGGAADILFEPASFEDLQNFLKQIPQGTPLTIIGGLANTIVRDGGVRGITIRLGKALSQVTVDNTTITAQSGALNGTVASLAAKNGLGGLEFLSGIPGTIGGATAMNAGAYGAEMADVLQQIHTLTRTGEPAIFTPQQLKMTYRRGNIPQGHIVTHITLKTTQEDTQTVRARLKAIKEKRNTTQPIRENTGGSTFANPSQTLRAWQVVDKVGGRGLTIGGAKMSEMHCNFMVNNGNATAHDLENLGNELIKRAHEQLSVSLNWEIKRIGEQ